MSTKGVVLAAEQESGMPKALHVVHGTPMTIWAARACQQATQNEPVIVVGFERYKIRACVEQFDMSPTFVTQARQLGTGHAVACVCKSDTLGKVKNVLVVNSDIPFVTANTLKKLTDNLHTHVVAILTTRCQPQDDACRRGIVIRDTEQNILEIVHDAIRLEDQFGMFEINVGAYCFDREWLCQVIDSLPLNSSTGDFCISDMVKIATHGGYQIACVECPRPEAFCVHSVEQLEEANRIARYCIFSEA